MKKPDLSRIVKKLEKEKSFSITRDEYVKLTGADTPQDKYYFANRSALAKKAKEHGFKLEIIPEKINIIKV